ncbi:hypothetical protein CSUI_010959 [Cystoisospora suis]|uniref:Uncharacterized protein n=1 Tax=Cystoisospora suis TaxID=483139 RepID=A0A2C6KDE5_9APIC|nr:hypothetical protein CSUI_010959 [Cystoisospora suis]
MTTGNVVDRSLYVKNQTAALFLVGGHGSHPRSAHSVQVKPRFVATSATVPITLSLCEWCYNWKKEDPKRAGVCPKCHSGRHPGRACYVEKGATWGPPYSPVLTLPLAAAVLMSGDVDDSGEVAEVNCYFTDAPRGVLTKSGSVNSQKGQDCVRAAGQSDRVLAASASLLQQSPNYYLVPHYAGHASSSVIRPRECLHLAEQPRIFSGFYSWLSCGALGSAETT